MPHASSLARFAGVLLLGLVLAGPAAAQDDLPPIPPGMTPEQARELLEQRPDLGARLREWVRSSGLSPQEIRQRLRAAGYPGNLLDQYMVADSLVPDSVPPGFFPQPSEAQFGAVSALGIAEISREDSLLFRGDTLALRLYRDSVRLARRRRLEREEERIRGLQLFGLEALRQPTTQFQPLVAGPVDDTYALGPGDEVALILTGDVELARSLIVSRDGYLFIPQVGRIAVNTLTLGQLRELLYDRLAAVYPGVSRAANPRTRFDITVTRVRVQAVRVIGEVARPGTYQIAASAGVMGALYEAGGPTERANFRSVEVHRAGRLVTTVDLYDYLIRGGVSAGALQAGDVILVPVRGARVKVVGEVRRPAIYEIRPGEGAREVLQYAGGLEATAATGRATIARIVPPEQRTAPGLHRTVVSFDLAETMAVTGPAVPLYDGDSLTVFPVLGGPRNQVTVSGSVWQPGTYELSAGMRLWDAVQAAGGLRPETYSGRAQIVRTFADSTRRMLAVTLPEPGAGPPAVNPELLERDSVLIYARTAFRPRRFVSVHGAVRHPDTLAFADSMTLRDAVLLAGGLTDAASLLYAEVTRLRPGTGGDTVASVLRVPLDSSYVFDPTAYLARPTGTAEAPSLTLHPFDNVLVHRIPAYGLPRNVTITGEVQHPGTYTLLTRDERLSDLITRAGGLLPTGYANGIRFFRRETLTPNPTARPPRRERATDADSTTGERPAASGQGPVRIPVDLAAVLRRPDHRENYRLEDGDSIHIPAYIPTVRVEGAVNAPTTVAHRPGAGIRYYVDAAGGYAQFADEDNTFVQQANGHVRKGGRPEAGSVVVVPQLDPELERPSTLPQILGLVGQLLAAATTIIIVLVR